MTARTACCVPFAAVTSDGNHESEGIGCLHCMFTFVITLYDTLFCIFVFFSMYTCSFCLSAIFFYYYCLFVYVYFFFFLMIWTAVLYLYKFSIGESEIKHWIELNWIELNTYNYHIIQYIIHIRDIPQLHPNLHTLRMDAYVHIVWARCRSLPNYWPDNR